MKPFFLLALAALASPLAAQSNDTSADPRARVFVARGCSDCHGIEGVKLNPRANVGPDLTTAYADVPSRYGVTLERFLDEPPGFMRIVLSEHTHLTRAETDSLVRFFRQLYEEHIARLDSLQRKVHPVRGGSPRQ